MHLDLNTHIASSYSNPSQKIRVLSELWTLESAYCPNCGNSLNEYPNNKPVADFQCKTCKEDYELKSKKNSIGSKIVDGAYSTMISRLQSDTSPNFFLLTYNQSFVVKDFLIIPKHFFTPRIIEKRTPLAITARRAGWVGCNILLNDIPESGKIFYIKEGEVIPKQNILNQWKETLFLRSESKSDNRSWLIEIMRTIDQLQKTNFSLDDLYKFEQQFSNLFPKNKHIKEKIRQQLQVLRDKGYIEFISPGQYRLIRIK